METTEQAGDTNVPRSNVAACTHYDLCKYLNSFPFYISVPVAVQPWA